MGSTMLTHIGKVCTNNKERNMKRTFYTIAVILTTAIFTTLCGCTGRTSLERFAVRTKDSNEKVQCLGEGMVEDSYLNFFIIKVDGYEKPIIVFKDMVGGGITSQTLDE